MRYNPDHRGVAKLLLSPEMGRAMRGVAQAGAAHARAIAPRDEGDYASSFDTSSEVRDQRQTGFIYNTADHAPAVEWGTDDTRGHHVLSRTIDFIEAGT